METITSAMLDRRIAFIKEATGFPFTIDYQYGKCFISKDVGNGCTGSPHSPMGTKREAMVWLNAFMNGWSACRESLQVTV